MANNLWSGAVRKGLAADRPTVPDFPSDTFGFYFATDTGVMYFGVSGDTGWQDLSLSVQGAPTAKTGDATLTIAELRNRIITATKATAVAFTLPTGTLTDAGLNSGGADIGSSFDWEIINLGSVDGATTLNAGTGHTIVGNAVVAISTTGVFRTRKTAANTFVTYRVG